MSLGQSIAALPTEKNWKPFSFDWIAADQPILTYTWTSITRFSIHFIPTNTLVCRLHYNFSGSSIHPVPTTCTTGWPTAPQSHGAVVYRFPKVQMWNLRASLFSLTLANGCGIRPITSWQASEILLSQQIITGVTGEVGHTSSHHPSHDYAGIVSTSHIPISYIPDFRTGR